MNIKHCKNFDFCNISATISKVFEKLIHSQINTYMSDNFSKQNRSYIYGLVQGFRPLPINSQT